MNMEKRRASQRKAQAKYLAKNRQKYRNYRKKQSKRNYAWYAELKSKSHCLRCRENHPACIQFHHLDKTQKDFNIADMVRSGFGIKRIEKELAKCIALCANCHAKEHFNTTHIRVIRQQKVKLPSKEK